MISGVQLSLRLFSYQLRGVDKGNGLIEIVQLRLFRWLRMSLTIISFEYVATHGPQLANTYRTNGSVRPLLYAYEID